VSKISTIESIRKKEKNLNKNHLMCCICAHGIYAKHLDTNEAEPFLKASTTHMCTYTYDMYVKNMDIHHAGSVWR
jgi:hypothetical protein